MHAHRDWLAALALASLFAFTGLGNHPLEAADEPRVAGIGWEAQHTGQWGVPHLGGEPFLEHPPLYYAVLGASIRLFGATEGVARLPGAIASALTLLLVFALARWLADRTAGFAALLALVGVAGFMRYSHRAVVDPMLMLFVAMGHAAYVRGVFGPGGDRAKVSAPWLLGVYGAAALAFWVKGFVGVVCVAGPLALDVLCARRWRALLSPAHGIGLPLLCAACAAWPLLLREQAGEAACRQFLLDNGLYRVLPAVAGERYVGGHVNPFWYYLTRVPGQLGAMGVFVPALAAWLHRGRLPEGWNGAALRFLAWVFPIGVLLLSLPGTKRGLYLLPFEPALAVALGAWLSAATRADPLRSRVECATTELCAALLRGPRGLAALWTRARGPRRWSAEASRAPLRAVALGFALALAWNLLAYPFTGRERDLGPLARAVAARVGTTPLAGLRLDESVRGALGFYSGLRPLSVDDADALGRALEDRGAEHLLAPGYLRHAVAEALGLAPVASWRADERDYDLYAL